MKLHFYAVLYFFYTQPPVLCVAAVATFPSIQDCLAFIVVVNGYNSLAGCDRTGERTYA